MVEDKHVIETLGKVRVVIENGEITEVGSSEMKYCPMFHAMHKVDELNEEFIGLRNKLLFDKYFFTGAAGAGVIRLLPSLTISQETAESFVTAWRDLTR